MSLEMKHLIRDLRRLRCSKSNRRKRQASYASAIEWLENRMLLSGVTGVATLGHGVPQFDGSDLSAPCVFSVGENERTRVSDSNLETGLETRETYQQRSRMFLYGDRDIVLIGNEGQAPAPATGAAAPSPRSVIEMATPQAGSAGTLSGLRAPGSPLLVDPTAPPVGAVGVLVRVRDRNGNQVRVGRIPADDPKRPRAISELEDDLGRTTTFTYSDLPGQEDLVEKIEQFQGAGIKRDWRFEYDSQRSLIKVSSPPSDWLDEAGVLRVHKSKQPVADLLALEDGNQQPANKNPNNAAQPETLEELRKRRAELELQYQKAERRQDELDQTGGEVPVDQQELARSLEEQHRLRDEMREMDQKILEQLKRQHAENQDELNRRAEEILVEEFGEGDREIAPHELKRLEETNPEFKVLVQDVHELEKLEKQIADLESQNAVDGRDAEDKKDGEQEKPNLSESQKREISRCLKISMDDVEKLLEEGELDLDSASPSIESLADDRIFDLNRLLFPGTDKHEEKGTLQIFFPPEQSHVVGQSADEENDDDGTADNTDDDEQSADSELDESIKDSGESRAKSGPQRRNRNAPSAVGGSKSDSDRSSGRRRGLRRSQRTNLQEDDRTDQFRSDGCEDWLEDRAAGENLYGFDNPPSVIGQNGEEQEGPAGLKKSVDGPNQRSGQNMRFEDGSRLNISKINQVFSHFATELADACLLGTQDSVSQNDGLEQLPTSEVAMTSSDEDDEGFAVPLHPALMAGVSLVPFRMPTQTFPTGRTD